MKNITAVERDGRSVEESQHLHKYTCIYDLSIGVKSCNLFFFYWFCKSSNKISVKISSWSRIPLSFINLLKPTGHVMQHEFNIQQLYALSTLYLCVLYLSEEKTATCATYSINWLVFIIEMNSVYGAVQTGSLNKAVCASSLKG